MPMDVLTGILRYHALQTWQKSPSSARLVPLWRLFDRVRLLPEQVCLRVVCIWAPLTGTNAMLLTSAWKTCGNMIYTPRLHTFFFTAIVKPRHGRVVWNLSIKVSKSLPTQILTFSWVSAFHSICSSLTCSFKHFTSTLPLASDSVYACAVPSFCGSGTSHAQLKVSPRMEL